MLRNQEGVYEGNCTSKSFVDPIMYSGVNALINHDIKKKRNVLITNVLRDVHDWKYPTMKFTGNTVRSKIINWTKTFIDWHGLGNQSFVGTVGHGATSSNWDMEYKAHLENSKIIVTCNPWQWEGDSRLWESLMSGALVMVDHMAIPNFMPYPLVHKKHLVYYDSTNQTEFNELLEYYVEHEDEARQIGEAGRRHVMDHHMPKDRVTYILDTIKSKIELPISSQKQGDDLSFLTQPKGEDVPSHERSAETRDAVVKNEEDKMMMKTIVNCSAAQRSAQINAGCDYYGGRHNLPGTFVLLRQHLPAAKLLVDIGANKGLVSARWLELWRPSWDAPTPRNYALNVVKRYWDVHHMKDTGRFCGVTDMCAMPNQTELDWLATVSPIPYDSTKDPLVLHSFEPSAPNYNIHVDFLANHTPINSTLSAHWKWHRIAVADTNGEVYFSQAANEGGKMQGRAHPNTRVATLDDLAFKDKLFGDDDVVIDALKVDAESVDALVLVGATKLLQQGRIRVIMWETPNGFPLHFPIHNSNAHTNGTVLDFVGLINFLDTVMNMSCYFPGKQGRYYRLTRCGAAELLEQVRCPCPTGIRCPLTHSNAFCVHREAGAAVYKAIETEHLVKHIFRDIGNFTKLGG